MYKTRILTDGITEDEARLSTLEVTFPRFILAEFNTHRALSRNSASSRAIPFKKQLTAIASDPFIPEHFPEEQKGMSGTEKLADYKNEMEAKGIWINALNNAVESAQYLNNYKVHKSITNRLLEPFMWHTAIISATDWDNFFELRCAPDAQPEIRKIAYMIKDELDASIPKLYKPGEWATPLIKQNERHMPFHDLRRLSVARCARVSYMTHDGKVDHTADVKLYNRLLSSRHMSPFEHIATPLPSKDDRSRNFKGWRQYRAIVDQT